VTGSPSLYGVTKTLEYSGLLAVLLGLTGPVLSSLAAPVYTGPSSRTTGLVISEIMYHPPARADGRNLEFIEIYNSNPFPEDLAGYRLAGDIDYTFPAGTRLGGGEFLVVAAVPADLQAVYGLTNALGPYTNNLSNDRGTVRLRKPMGALLLEVNYTDQWPWPLAADGAGHSLVCARPSYGENDVRAWRASDTILGSPGAVDPVQLAGLGSQPLQGVVINEFLARAASNQTEFLELFNHGTNAYDLSGCWLSDDPATNKFRIPDGTWLAAGGYLAFDLGVLPFGLGAADDEILLVNSNRTRVLDAVRYGGQAAGIPWGRSPNGSGDWRALALPTRGQPNAPLWQPDLVINEIMYHPITGEEADEYLELHNRSAATVQVGGWRFVDGIDFALPDGASIAADGFLVVAKNRNRLLSRYPDLNPSLVYGDYSGNLSDRGERIALARPDFNVTTNGTNAFYVVADEVTYRDGGRWGQWSDGGGSSLELADARADRRQPANWADSDETGKSTWTSMDHTELLVWGHPTISNAIDQCQLFLLDKGEALVDDLELIWNGANRIGNGAFDSGISGWGLHGTHRLSRWESQGGYNGGALRVVATDRGDVVNRLNTALSATLATNTSATLRLRARWLRGHPELLVRTAGGSLEAVAALPVPANLGTPGAPNSRATTNAGPAIHNVAHWPPLPPAGQPFAITAQAADPDGLTSLIVRYRLDPSSTVISLPMNDGGTNGDLVAGDGVFTALIPAQTNGTMVAFYVEASDAAPASASSRFPADAPARECLARVGETLVGGGFGSYRIWMTQSNLNFWISREKSSNEDLDATFVYGNERVVYNVGAHYGCSENYSTGVTSPISGNLVGYNLNFPAEDAFLGTRNVRLDFPTRDPTFQREPLMHWILDQYGLPSLYRRFIRLSINGVARGDLQVDTQRPGNDLLDEFFEDDNQGDLYKLNPWFEANPSGAIINANAQVPRLTNYLRTDGTPWLARYRFTFQPRAQRGSANDYTNLLALIAAANATPAAYPSLVGSVIAVENWMRTFAMNDLASYWDGFGNVNAKNSYLYKPERSGWKILSWDFDVGLGANINTGINGDTNAPLFQAGIDPTQQRLFDTPALVRHYWRAIEEAVYGFFNAAPGTAIDRMLSERYAAFQAQGVAAAASPYVPSGVYNLSVADWINSRRGFILTQLAAVQTNFQVLGPAAFSTNRNVALISGTAPLALAYFKVNGVSYPANWTSVQQWQLAVPLASGTNNLEITGYDRLGQPLTNVAALVTASFTGTAQAPEACVGLNEIMYNPARSRAGYLELFNRSATTTFDLTGWRINGVDFTFGETLIGPGQFLVVASDAGAFINAYGNAIPLAGVFGGQLDNGGETLTLLKPGPLPGQETVVSRVTYDDDPPWPPGADGWGNSLELIDPSADASRVANWSDGGGWRFHSYTASSSVGGTRLSLYFETNGGDVFLDDFCLVAGSVAGEGTNLLTNPGFEYPLAPAWQTGPLAAATIRTQGLAHAGSASLHLIVAPGALSTSTFYQDIPAVTNNATYTLSFWWRPGSSGTNLNARLNAAYRTTVNPSVTPLCSPGATNTMRAPLPPFPPLWLSEVQPDNRGLAWDNQGEAEPWIELFNAGADALALDGCFLANQYSNLTQWAFPADAVIQAGQYLLVWADGEPEETAGTNLHAGFRLSTNGGAVALSRMVNGSPQLLDYLNYPAAGANRSYGAWPPGQASYRQEFDLATPGLSNNPVRFAPALFINEWMAANGGAVRDPADGDADDWFELYNATTNWVDLAGYRLTDTLSDPNKFVIPDGFRLPPRGFLLVWADEETGQSATNGDLHVNFKLSQEGETIALYSPHGVQVDAVTFGIQAVNQAEGRFPNGGARYFMPSATPRLPNAAPRLPAHLQLPGVVPGSSGWFTFAFETLPGRIYRLEYKDDLALPTWNQQPEVITGDGGVRTITNSIEHQPRRFYRLATE